MAKEYVGTKELARRLRYAEQTIYNKICDGTFMEGVHFFKPTKRKLLFDWKAIEVWVEGNCEPDQPEKNHLNDHKVARDGGRDRILPKCRINI